MWWGFSGGSGSKEFACHAEDLSLIPRSGRFPWRRAYQPTPVFLSEEFHGQRSLVGYSPWGLKVSDMNGWLTLGCGWHVLRIRFGLCFFLRSITEMMCCSYCIILGRTQFSFATFLLLFSQLCQTLCDHMDCSLPGSSVHGISQARILELPFPSPGNPHLLHWQVDFLELSHQRSSRAINHHFLRLYLPDFSAINCSFSL